MKRFKNMATALLLMLAVSMGNGLQAQETITDEQLLNLYAGLRVADVCDGMDMVGLRDVGTMDASIEPLWRDVETFGHRFQGIAVTARYVPTNKVVKNPMEKSEFQKWEGSWYNEISSEPFVPLLKKGSVVVLDVQGDGDVGSVGSYNALMWMGKGACGIVSNGGIRDIDEVVKEKIPVYLNYMERGRGIRPGRNEIESVNKPVTVGGVLVRPGDVIVADGDGVIVVPREYAKQVAAYALEIMNKDKGARKDLYQQLDMPLDNSVQ
ncbi:MAG: RraA family protein [Bacteroidales bacterium]|nr:RraA family protein [Bacteroidales bacterium]